MYTASRTQLNVRIHANPILDFTPLGFCYRSYIELKNRSLCRDWRNCSRMMRRIAVACVYTMMVPMLLASGLVTEAKSIASQLPDEPISCGASIDPVYAFRPGDRRAGNWVNVNRSVIDPENESVHETTGFVLPQLRVKYVSTPLPSILVPPD